MNEDFIQRKQCNQAKWKKGNVKTHEVCYIIDAYKFVNYSIKLQKESKELYGKRSHVSRKKSFILVEFKVLR